MRPLRRSLPIALTVFAAACSDGGEGRILGIEATGIVEGLVYFDVNATRTFDGDDVPFPNVAVGLVPIGSADTIVRASSDDDGLFVLPAVLVGSYQIAVDTVLFADSAVVSRIDTADVTVTPDDSIRVTVAISFPILSVAEALAMPVGEKMFIDGIALNAPSTFGDSTIHVADTSGTLRAIRAGPGTVFPGDSVRLRGTIATRTGRPVLDLDRLVPIVLAIAEVPPPDTVTTGTAAGASSGALDAAFVRIDSARVRDTLTVDGDIVATVDDGSGALGVLLEQHIPFGSLGFLVPGADLKVSGLLVPAESGVWQLKPRFNADLEVNVPVISITDARTKPVGELVFIDGVALIGLTTFGDGTLHIADASGAIRATRVHQAVIFPGDSVRLIGRIAIREGQAVVDDAESFTLGFSRTPPPTEIETNVAASASGGLLDAALVKVFNATIGATATVAGDFVLTVDDGTGPLEVVLDQSIPFSLGPFTVGVVVDATGVLVPTGSGSWQLKPTSPGDILIK
jgi:hypothetical protein